MAGDTVGAVRPTQLLTTYGVGATVDLPQLSVMVMGLDDWPVNLMEQIHEDRLLQVVRYVLQSDVKQLKAAPIPDRDGLAAHKFGVNPSDGVPVAAFPRWLVCTHCRLLAPISSALFDFRREFYRPEMSRFVHTNCIRTGTARPEAIPARFLVACEAGHIDDFPWNEYLHDGAPGCSGQLELRDVGVTGEAIDVFLVCRACQKRKPMGLAFTENGRARLPRCRGWHPHLRVAPAEACGNEVRPMLLGATNQWFSSAYSALSIPSSSDPLEQMVEQDLTGLFDGVESAREAGLSRRGHHRYDTATDEQIWQAIQKLRSSQSKDPISPQKLKIPEWRLFSKPDPKKNGRDLHLRAVPPPATFQAYIEQVVLVEKLREVRALVGFSRLESAGDDSLTKLAPLRRGNVEWVPAAEIRGEGVFLRFSENAVADWESRCTARNAQFLQAHRRWRQQRRLDPDVGYPGLRYTLLHSLSHAF